MKIAAFNALTLSALIICLPLTLLFGSGSSTGRSELALALICFAVPVIASGPGGVYLGALEGVGRTTIAAIIAGLGPLVALPCTLVAASAGAGLAPLCAIQGLSVASPRACAWIYWKLRPSTASPRDRPQSPTTIRPRLVLQMITISAAVLIQTGIDPVIVSSRIGAESAGAYGLAYRIVTGALVPLMVLTPMFGGNIAATRAAGWPRSSNERLWRLLVRSGYAGIAAGTVVAAAGPFAARLIGHGKVSTPEDLYVAGALFVLITYLTMPLYLAFSGPTGLAWSVKLYLVLTPVNLAASIALVSVTGPSGPLWASVLTTAAAGIFWSIAWRYKPAVLAETHNASDQDPRTALRT